MALIAVAARRAGARLARGAVRVGRRLRVIRPVTLLLVVLLAMTGGVLLWRPGEPVGGGVGSSPQRVGVRDGDMIPAYAESSRAELDELSRLAEPDRAVPALVSLRRYLTAGQLADLFDGVDGVTAVFALARAPLPARQTEIVRLAADRLPDDVAASMASVAARKVSEATDYAARASTEQNPDRRRQWSSRSALALAESQAFADRCACVFAVVVRGRPAALRSLASRPAARVVDPAPEVDDIDATVFVAVLPEQVDHVRPPPDIELPPPEATPVVG